MWDEQVLWFRLWAYGKHDIWTTQIGCIIYQVVGIWEAIRVGFIAVMQHFARPGGGGGGGTLTWHSCWRHQMETYSALLALAGNSPITDEFPSQRSVTRSVEVFFDLRLNKRLSKQSYGWWLETSLRSLWGHFNAKWSSLHLYESSDIFLLSVDIYHVELDGCHFDNLLRS